MSTFFSRPRAFTPLFTLLLALTLLLAVPACGGGGNGMPAMPESSLIIPDTTLPLSLSGEVVEYEIPLEGGCSGPYVLTMIDGRMPDGMGTDDEDGRHHLVGTMLTAGVFNFTVQVTDIGCDPFITTTAKYVWDIGVGTLQIVGASPNLIPVDQYDDAQKWPDADALPKTVYSSFMAVDFIVAGGIKPYFCQVVDDPDDPDDGALPLGTSMPSDGTSIVGTPVEVGAGGKPFRLTIRAMDSTGQTVDRKIQWKVDTPAIVISNSELGDGQAGAVYGDLIQIADGVPPFVYELLDDLPTVADEDITNNSPLAPTFPSDTGFTVAVTGEATNKIGPGGGSTATYPTTSDVGPNYTPFPSEGLYLIEDGPDGGTFTGIPRRRGTFTVLVHAYSDLVPNERGQHSFKALSFTIAGSEPPTVRDPFGFNYSFTDEGVRVAAPTYSTIPEFEIGKVYNPDALTHSDPGLQLVAEGGVPADGYTDAPHEDQRQKDLLEIPGSYLWAGVWNIDDTSLPNPPPGIAMQPAATAGFSNGVIEVVDEDALVRQSRELAQFTCYDFQLPDSFQNATYDKFGFSVGPDVVIITHSTSSLSTYYNYWSAPQRHEWNDHAMKIMKFQGFSSGPERSVLADVDFTKGHSMPADAGLASAANPLGELLSGVATAAPDLDLLRCTIVATGWWDDMHGLNPKGGRHWQHSEANRGYAYYGQFGTSYSNHGNYQPSCSAVDLPDSEGVTENRSAGIFTNGGRLYHFESNTHFGAFILRTDGTVYVPFAYKKDSVYNGFGDGLLMSKAKGVNSALRTVQMTISPDGRFGAMKLKRNALNLYENATDSGFVVFSLTGEKPFNGETYVVAGSGVSQTGLGNRILYASSMALTNGHLYFLIGSRSASSTSTSSSPLYYQSWGGHYFMRYELEGGASDASLLASANGDSEWKQASGISMQTTYHHHGPHYSTGSYLNETYLNYGYWPYHRYWHEDGMNLNEQSVAPTPFRVSANGEAVAFMAGSDPGQTTASSLIYSNYAWVDYAGAGARRASTTRRHCYQGSGRNYTLSFGPAEYAMWGRYSGPTSAFEISDDGLALAFVYNTNSGTIYSNYSYSSSSHSWMRYRDNVQLCSTSSSDKWATLNSTTQDSVTASVFTGSHRWRFGSLAFTKDNEGLVFWAGAPVYQANSTSYSYNQSYQLAGTYYHHTLGTTNSCRGMCTTTEGGQGTSTYTSSSQFNPSTTSGTTSSAADSATDRRYGTIQPMGGFMSNSREMLYIVTYGAISTSDATGCKLVGLNVKSTPGTGYLNSTYQHLNGEGFVLTDWPSRRGFVGHYYYYPMYPLYYGYAPMKKQGAGMQVMAKDTGWVFWGANYQYSGPARSYSSGGPPIRTYYMGAYGYGGVGMYGFNADLGGAVKQLNNPADSPNNTSSTYWGKLHYMEVARDGSSLSYLWSAYYYYDRHDQERIHAVRDIDFSTAGTGAMHPGFSNTEDYFKLQGSNGRGGEAMAPSSSNPNDLWYSFKQGGSNETSQELVRARYDDTTNSWTFQRFTSLSGRQNTLYATR